MGLLLMSYEYQRAKQKCNMLELKSIRLNDMQERYQKRIANIEKLFSKKKTSLESNYNNLQHNLSAQMSSLVSAGNYTGITSIFAGLNVKDDKGIGNLANTSLDALNGKITETDALTSKNQQLANVSTVVAQLQAMLQTVITSLKEAALEELEVAEDRQREPIAEKDAEIQADVAANDTALELAKQREESAKARLGEDVKGSVAHYGLS